jgi:hypothetical protein
MAGYDQNGWLWRLRSQLPRWFGDLTQDPVTTGILSGLAWCHAAISSWFFYAKQQTRIATATGQSLDDICYNSLGTRIFRNPGESDTACRARFTREILRPKATRAALLQEVMDTTGSPGILIEPQNPSDCGGYASLAHPGVGGGCACDTAGAYGSLQLPFQYTALTTTLTSAEVTSDSLRAARVPPSVATRAG